MWLCEILLVSVSFVIFFSLFTATNLRKPSFFFLQNPSLRPTQPRIEKTLKSFFEGKAAGA